MKKTIIVFIAALLCMSPLSAKMPMTLQECIDMAVANNKSIVAADHGMMAAAYTRKSVGALFLPSLSVEGSALYSNADGGYQSGMGQLPVLGVDGVPTGQTALFPGIGLNYQLGWIFNAAARIEQPIFMGGRILANYRMAGIGREMAWQNRRLTESEVIVETSRAYANVVEASQMCKVAEAYNQLLSQLMRNVEKARSHGMKSNNDVLKVQVRLDESVLALRRAENARRLATMNLCHHIGRPLTDDIVTDSILPQVDYLSAELTTDISSRPEALLLAQQTDMARQKVVLARSEWLPEIGLVGQYGYLNGVKLNDNKLFDNWSFMVGVQVKIPIFDFGHRYNKIRASKQQYAQAMARRIDTDEQLQLEAVQAANNLDEAVLESRLAASSVASAEENLRSSRLCFEKGTETLADFLEAQTLWADAHKTEVKARVQCYVRWLEYRKAIGQIN
ncbi:MAG: TolC family protein [Muribaculaceae bacterium]